MAAEFTIHVNGKTHTVHAEPDTPLLYILRNELKLNGPKFGCGLQQCGACMVLMDGKARPSCQFPVSAVKARKITSLEGLAKEDGSLHPVQQAFIDEQAAQCGYCLNGSLMAAVSLLNQVTQPDETTIRQNLHINICRCGVHSRVIRAILKASEKH